MDKKSEQPDWLKLAEEAAEIADDRYERGNNPGAAHDFAMRRAFVAQAVAQTRLADNAGQTLHAIKPTPGGLTPAG